MKLYRKSKNLIPFPYRDKNGKVDDGITFTSNDDGSIVINGQNDGVGNSVYYILTVAENFILKAGVSYTLSITTNSNRISATAQIGSNTWYNALKSQPKKIIVGEDTPLILYAQVVKGDPTIYVNECIKIMLNEGETALPYEPYAGQRVKLLYGSKNLIPFPTSGQYFEGKSYINNGITYTVGKDGLISIKGKIPDDATQKYSFYIFAVHDLKNPLLAEIGTYTISAEVVSGTLSGRELVEVRNLRTDGTSVQLKCNIASEGEGRTFNIANGKIQRLSVLVEGIGTEVDCTFRIMLNKGTTALPYDKYFPLSKMNLYLKSRNLIPYPYTRLPSEQNGITITDNGDGTFYLNGTNTAGKAFNLYLSPEGMEAPFEVGEAFAISSGVSKTYAYVSYFKEDGTIETLSGDVGKVGNYKIWGEGWKLRHIIIQIAASAVYDNVLVKPMLNEGITALPYEPPQEYPN